MTYIPRQAFRSGASSVVIYTPIHYPQFVDITHKYAKSLLFDIGQTISCSVCIILISNKS